MAYATLSEVKRWLDIQTDDKDALLTALMEASTQAIEAYTNRPIERKTATEGYYGSNSPLLFVRRSPIVAVQSVTILGQPIPFTFDTIAIRRTGGFFGTEDYVTVGYTAGFSPVPGDAKLAYQMTVSAMFNAQAMDPNLTGESLGGTFSGGFDQYGAGAVPRAARSLLNNYMARYFVG